MEWKKCWMKNYAKNINNYKNEGGKKNPTTMTGWKIEDQGYLYCNDAGTKKLFLLHDSWIDYPERILEFGLEKALDHKWTMGGAPPLELKYTPLWNGLYTPLHFFVPLGKTFKMVMVNHPDGLILNLLDI